ncbi:MAG: lipid-A-disaccharide synthase N-terminal domain-containing protein [Candidatus Omnitrophota bacterium]|nr:MAG: lipid-A-disaccharide synthase N-terminal domain-containing protein [Candidatus Omnitrophota bacterium]
MRLNINVEIGWLVLGFLGQFLFFLRFFFQWLVSERKRESVIPLSFWYLSICGGLLILCYAIYRKDPVFILGQSMGVFIYARNLLLIHRKKG